jgi:molybdenum cofactor cytidylyltransferase
MPQTTAIVLAAGQSTRMGEENKLLLPFRNKTILETVVDTLLSVPVEEIVIVTGFEDRQIRDVLASYHVRVAYNPEFAAGMSTSIRRGILAIGPEVDGYMICLADMPGIKASTIKRLLDVFSVQKEPSIVVPTIDGHRGHPVIFHRAFRNQLLQLHGDTGAREVILNHPEAVVEVTVDDEGIFQDIDTRINYNDMFRT